MRASRLGSAPGASARARTSARSNPSRLTRTAGRRCPAAGVEHGTFTFRDGDTRPPARDRPGCGSAVRWRSSVEPASCSTPNQRHAVPRAGTRPRRHPRFRARTWSSRRMSPGCVRSHLGAWRGVTAASALAHVWRPLPPQSSAAQPAMPRSPPGERSASSG
jgi:hypothetical protein